MLDQAIEVTLEMLLVAFGNMFGFRTCFAQQYITHMFDQFDLFALVWKCLAKRNIKPLGKTQFSWCLVLAYESEAARAIGQTLVVTVVCNGTGPRALNTYLSRESVLCRFTDVQGVQMFLRF